MMAKRELCSNKIAVEDCYEAFLDNEYSCNSVEFPFERNCREFCEFCTPNRGDARRRF